MAAAPPSIKTAFNGDCRRLPPLAAGASLADLVSLVRSTYGLGEAARVVLTFVDDEDEQVVIGSTEELEEASRIAVAEKRPCLKISVAAAHVEDGDEDADGFTPVVLRNLEQSTQAVDVSDSTVLLSSSPKPASAEKAPPAAPAEESTDDDKKEKKEKKKKGRHEGVKCDMCGVTPITGVRFKCAVCPDFDLCAECEPLHDPLHVLLKVKVPDARLPVVANVSLKDDEEDQEPDADEDEKVAAAGRKAGKPSAAFVRDVSLPDNTQVAPGAHVAKTWRVTNNGHRMWPADARLCFVSGDLRPSESVGTVHVPRLRPGEETNLTVQLEVPPRTGVFSANFRLSSRGVRFGPRLWSIVDAVEDLPAPKENEEEEAAEDDEERKAEDEDGHEETRAPSEPFVYEDQLRELEAMGFKDAEVCRFVLIQNKGNVQQTVDWLLSQSE